MNNPESEARASIFNHLERNHGDGFPPWLKGMRCGARIKLKDFTGPDVYCFLMNKERLEIKNPHRLMRRWGLENNILVTLIIHRRRF